LMWLILSNVLKLTLTGLVIGFAASLALGRVIASFLYDITATDPRILTVVSALLVTIAVVATYIPARRAAGVAPSAAFKSQ